MQSGGHYRQRNLKDRAAASREREAAVFGLLCFTRKNDTIKAKTGAAVGMMMPYGRDPMKTQVGKSIHKLGVAVDHAVDSIVSEMR